MKSIIYLIFIWLLVCTNIGLSQQYPKRELRGAWVATVKNIDWPSSPSATSGEQISELVQMFDKLKAAGINTIYFQVRTECDALYKSSYEPWSYWLTGKQGKAPDPFFDPLKFAVDEAHSRGMELHAWINPYRAVRETGEYENAPNHVTKVHSEWILKFENYKMLNPGIPGVTNYITQIVTDIVSRYDVDGIHLDDYFYPYSPKITNEDSAAFRIYKGAFINIDDWRRNNINLMVAQVYTAINKINPKIKFGVSPFGIVENKYAGTNGFNSYDMIYCDPLNWIKDKTVDYVAPQLYWEIGNKSADFSKLLPWWASQEDERQIYIGLFSSKMTGTDWKGNPSELYNEIRLTRKFQNIDGIIFFSAKSISENYSGLGDSLKYSIFKYPAFVPEMKWKHYTAPSAPPDLTVEKKDSIRTIKWSVPILRNDSNLSYIIYRFNGNERVDLNNPENIIKIIYNDTTYTDSSLINYSLNKITYVVTSLNREQMESKDFAINTVWLREERAK